MVAGGAAPGTRPWAMASLTTPAGPVFCSLHFHHPRASHQAAVEKEPPDKPLVVPDGACGVSG